MVLMMDISTALTGAKAAYDILATSIAARDEAKIQAALTELQRKHTDLTASAMTHIEKAFNLQADLIKARDEIARLESKIDQKESYDLFEVAPGKFCYRSNKGDAPLHHLCQPCWDRGVKSVLQTHAAGGGWPAQMVCSTDAHHNFYKE